VGAIFTFISLMTNKLHSKSSAFNDFFGDLGTLNDTFCLSNRAAQVSCKSWSISIVRQWRLIIGNGFSALHVSQDEPAFELRQGMSGQLVRGDRDRLFQAEDSAVFTGLMDFDLDGLLEEARPWLSMRER
jgi:hypothetical protein